MKIVITGFSGYVALSVIMFCIYFTIVRACMDLHDMWMLRKWKKNNQESKKGGVTDKQNN